ncbi:MAG: HAD family hydrolase [Candidatus Bruticola sp.]
MLFFGSKPIKLVLFDIGGVFVEAELDRYVQLGCAAFKTTPAPLQREIARLLPSFETGSINSDEFWRAIGENLWKSSEGSLSIVNNCGEFWRNIFRATVRVDERMVRLAEALRHNGLAVGALSNTISEHAEILEEMGFYALFEPCVLSCRAGLRKPQAEIFKLAADKGGVSPKQCLFIDDQQINTEAAQRVGMDALVFTSVEKLYQDLVQKRLLA